MTPALRNSPAPGIDRRTLVRAIALGIALLTLPGLAGTRATAAPDLFDELYVRIRDAEAQRQTIRARFTETTVSSLLVRPMISEGTLVGAKPASLRMSYTSPDRRTIVMDGRRLAIVRPDTGERELVDITQIMKRVDHYFVNATPEDLRKSFAVRAFVDPEARASYQLDLVPTRRQIREGLDRLQIWVTRDPLLLSQIRITFAGGDTTTVRIEGAELNVAVPPDAFDVGAVPGGRKK